MAFIQSEADCPDFADKMDWGIFAKGDVEKEKRNA